MISLKNDITYNPAIKSVLKLMKKYRDNNIKCFGPLIAVLNLYSNISADFERNSSL